MRLLILTIYAYLYRSYVINTCTYLYMYVYVLINLKFFLNIHTYAI